MALGAVLEPLFIVFRIIKNTLTRTLITRIPTRRTYKLEAEKVEIEPIKQNEAIEQKEITSEILSKTDDIAVKAENSVEKKTSVFLSKLTPEMEAKILEGQRIIYTNKIIGGHSPNINNANSQYVVEIVKINEDGTKVVKYITQFKDGKLSNIKTSTLFPDHWSDKEIIDAINYVGNTKPIGERISTGDTLHRFTLNGVEIDVIKKGNNIISGYPSGGKPTLGFNLIK